MFIYLLYFEEQSVSRFKQSHNRREIQSATILLQMTSAQLLSNRIAFTFSNIGINVDFIKDEYAKRAFEKVKEATANNLSYLELDARILQLGGE